MLVLKNTDKTYGIIKDNDYYFLFTMYKSDSPSARMWLYKTTKVDIELQGIKLYKPIESIYYMAVLNIRFPDKYVKYIKDLRIFIPKVKNGHICANTPKAYFLNPIEINIDGNICRMIPYAPNYAVTEDAQVFDIETCEKRNPITTPTYKRILLNKKEYALHILVASAWCENPDWQNNVVVDHIDGVKTNNCASNLRWVSVGDNARLTKLQGLKNDAKPCILKNLNTDEVWTFYSTGDAFAFLNRRKTTAGFVNLGTDRPYIIKHNKGYFQLQYQTDNPKWVTLAEGMHRYKRRYRKRYILTIRDKKTSTLYKYNNLDDISKFINNGKKYISLKEAIKDLEATGKYRVSKETVDDCDKISYIAMNTITNEILYADSTTPLITLCGVAKACIRKSAINQGRYVYNDWSFKEDDGTEFDTVKVPFNVSKRILLTDVVTGKVTEYTSYRDAARFLNTQHHSISRAANSTNNIIQGFKVTLAK
jgi:NUMOD1 domain